MAKGKLRVWVDPTIVCLFLLLPVTCLAQAATSTSFGDLLRSVRPGNVVIVTDTGGREERGQVADVSEASLVILTKDPNGQWTNRRTFTPPDVREIKRTGKMWDKALLGFAIGVAITAGAEECSGCWSKSEVAAVSGGIGAGIGFAFDAAFGPKRVYRAPVAGRAAVTVRPIIEPRRTGGMLAVRF